MCPVCGSPVPYVFSARPRIYCCDNCRDVAKFMSALEKCLIKLKPSDGSKKLLAGDLFRLANLVTNGTKR